MNASEKILYLLSQIETANQLSADNQPCFIDPDAIDEEKVSGLELRTIFEKFEADGIIRFLEKPTGNVVRTNKPNHSNYKIELLPTFDAYYDKIYASNRFGIKNLTFDNYYKIFAVAELINQDLNIRTDGIATFEADKSTATLWKGVHEKSISLYHIKQIYSKALGFLQEIGAISSYELYKPSSNSTTQLFKVTASRRKFESVFLELILNSPRSKTSSLTKKLVINSRPKPQPNYFDDTATGPNNTGEQPSEPISTAPAQDRVRFDAKASKLTYNGKSCGIPDETLEYYICKLVFKNRRVAAKEDDILEYTTKSQESQRAVYDAMLRINKKANKQLGTPKLLRYRAAKVRITAKYQ